MLKKICEFVYGLKAYVFALLCLLFVLHLSYSIVYTKYIPIMLRNTSVSANMTSKSCFNLISFEQHIAKRNRIELRNNSSTVMQIRNEHVNGNTLNLHRIRSKSCKRFVTLGRYMGRMGNQMFEIASLIGTAYKYDVIPIISDTIPLRKYFELPNLVDLKLNKLLNSVSCVCKKSGLYFNCTKEFNMGKNISLRGFLQSWKYFKEAKDIIKTVFKLNTMYLLNAQRFLTNVSIAGYQRVCIHIRRGDILRKAKREDGYVIAGLDFIEKAKQFYRDKYSKVQFLVVSNDKFWCRKYLRHVVISPLTNPGDDMALMALSHHVVVTAGTFGWWGAWLSGGTTVYFNKHPRPGSNLASRMSREDFYPPNWVGLS